MADLVVVKGVHRGAFAKVVEGSVVIGRAADADLSLGEDAKASHRHARVSALGNERYFLEDLGSTNGTFVNNERVEQTPLRSGDLVKIGRSLIVFRAGASSVRLEDVATNDGGSTGSIARRSDMSAEEAASSSAVDLPPGAQRAPEDTAVRQALQELIVAAGEVALASGLDRTLAVVQRAVGGTRVLLFLRHPMTGGLGCAASRADPSMASTPVESSLLARAVRGEVVAGDHAAAAPIRIQGLPAGALYVDGCANKPGGLDVLVAACVLAGLQVGLDRSRRLASGASEIVGLGQAKVEKRALDLSAHLGAAEQMYVNAAQQRGVTLEVAAPPGVVVNVDPGLFSRGLDRLVEHVLNDARGWIGMSLVPADPGRARLLLRATLSQVPEPPGTILSPQGVAADLRHAWEVFGDGMLAVARVALQRAGARLSAQPDGPTVVFMLEMEPTTL